MLETIKKQEQEILDFQIVNIEQLESFRIEFLSRKGKIPSLFDQFKQLQGSEKKDIGKPLNLLKRLAEEKYSENKERFRCHL